MLIFRVCFHFSFAKLSAGKQFNGRTSRDGLVTRFDDLVNGFKQEFNQIIQEEIECERNDIIQLNVGGQKFTTTRSTLRQVNGSLLATMFSESMEHVLKHDQDGAIVLDFNPEHFSSILNYLRAKKILTPKNPAVLPRVPKDQKENFDIFFDYLGLSDELTRLTEKFNLRSSQVSLQENGRVAVHDSTQGHTYVLGFYVIVQLLLSFVSNVSFLLHIVVKGFKCIYVLINVPVVSL